MGATDLIGFLTAGKTALDIFKGIRDELPKGQKADEVRAQIELAEQAFQNSNAEAAKSLGYELCRCTFPPQIMLWKQEKRTNVCSLCGNESPRYAAPRHDPD